MRSAWILLPLALVSRSTVAQVRSTAVDTVPVFREPRHHVVFQNALVRVLDVRIPSGDTTLYHLHTNRHIGVVISSASTWHQTPGQPASSVDTLADPVGSILDNAGEPLPYTHRVANADTVALRYVVGQLLSSSGVDAPALPASSTLRLDRETAGARVYIVTLAPGQSTEVHRHAQPGLTVEVGPGALRLEGTAPEAASPHAGAGTWWWRGAGTQHVLRNVGAQPLEVVEIDWR
jgi:mannose-6-phosphate isomerase-like protein (cupin superfamily)